MSAHAISVAQATTVLTALGQAYRHDWSEVDGRTIRSQLTAAALLIDRAAKGEATEEERSGFLVSCGVCRESCLTIPQIIERYASAPATPNEEG